MSARSGLVALLLADETSRRAFEETLADWREERGRTNNATARLSVELRGCVSLLRVFVGTAHRHLFHRQLWFEFGWTLLATALVAIATADVNLLPRALATLFIFAGALGLGERPGRLSPLFGKALVTFAFALVMFGWVTPAANRVFHELSLPELIREVRKDPAHSSFQAQALSTRLALSVAAPVCLLLGSSIRRHKLRLQSWHVLQGIGGVAAVGVFVVAHFGAPLFLQFVHWPTAVRLERLNIELWLALALACGVVVFLSRERGTGTENHSAMC